MGLAEKKIQNEFDTQKVPAAVKYYAQQTEGATGHLQIAIDWASFGDDKQAYANLDSLWQQPLQGLEAVCEDATGKSAVKDGLKKIIIKNAAQYGTDFKEGVFTVTMNFKAGNDASPGWAEYKKLIENSL